MHESVEETPEERKRRGRIERWFTSIHRSFQRTPKCPRCGGPTMQRQDEHWCRKCDARWGEGWFRVSRSMERAFRETDSEDDAG